MLCVVMAAPLLANPGRARRPYRPELARSSEGLAPSVCVGLLSQTQVPPGESSRALAVS
jgi:hypothetical protein